MYQFYRKRLSIFSSAIVFRCGVGMNQLIEDDRIIAIINEQPSESLVNDKYIKLSDGQFTPIMNCKSVFKVDVLHQKIMPKKYSVIDRMKHENK